MMFRLGVQLFPIFFIILPCSEFHGLRSCAPQVWQVPALRVGLKPSRSAQHRDAPRHWFHGSYEAGTGIHAWNSMESGMPELKQNKHFTSYLTSHHQRKATKVAAHQILSDPIRSVRSYQVTVYPVYPVYICFEAHCVACGRRRYPPR